MRQRGARDWVLLRAFCQQHGLSMDASRMVHLAADNDWVHFLAETSTQSYSYQEVSRSCLNSQLRCADLGAQCTQYVISCVGQVGNLWPARAAHVSQAPVVSCRLFTQRWSTSMIAACSITCCMSFVACHLMKHPALSQPLETPTIKVRTSTPSHSDSEPLQGFSTAGTTRVSITKIICTRTVS